MLPLILPAALALNAATPPLIVPPARPRLTVPAQPRLIVPQRDLSLDPVALGLLPFPSGMMVGPSGPRSQPSTPISFVGSAPAVVHGTGSTSTFNFSSLRDASGNVPTIEEFDCVIVMCGTLSLGDNLGEAFQKPAGYTSAHTDLHIGGTSTQCNLLTSLKFMGAVPDTSLVMPNPASSSAMQIYVPLVLRGVNAANPFDVASVTATGAASAVPNPPSITPVTAGTWILSTGVESGLSMSGASILTRPADCNSTTNMFRAAVDSATSADVTAALGIITTWASGAINPAAFGGGGGINGCWAAASIALRRS